MRGRIWIFSMRRAMIPEKFSSFMCIITDVASVVPFLLWAAINKECKDIFRLSRVTFNRIYEVYVHFQITKHCLRIEYAINLDSFSWVNGQRIKILFESEEFCCCVATAEEAIKLSATSFEICFRKRSLYRSTSEKRFLSPRRASKTQSSGFEQLQQ